MVSLGILSTHNELFPETHRSKQLVSLCLTNTESCNWTYFSFVLTLKAYNQIWVITVAALAYTLIDTDYTPPLATETGPEDGGRDAGFIVF